MSMQNKTNETRQLSKWTVREDLEIILFSILLTYSNSVYTFVELNFNFTELNNYSFSTNFPNVKKIIENCKLEWTVNIRWRLHGNDCLVDATEYLITVVVLPWNNGKLNSKRCLISIAFNDYQIIAWFRRSEFEVKTNKFKHCKKSPSRFLQLDRRRTKF